MAGVSLPSTCGTWTISGFKFKYFVTFCFRDIPFNCWFDGILVVMEHHCFSGIGLGGCQKQKGLPASLATILSISHRLRPHKSQKNRSRSTRQTDKVLMKWCLLMFFAHVWMGWMCWWSLMLGIRAGSQGATSGRGHVMLGSPAKVRSPRFASVAMVASTLRTELIATYCTTKVHSPSASWYPEITCCSCWVKLGAVWV